MYLKVASKVEKKRKNPKWPLPFPYLKLLTFRPRSGWVEELLQNPATTPEPYHYSRTLPLLQNPTTTPEHYHSFKRTLPLLQNPAT
jgi:hypothetical protein